MKTLIENTIEIYGMGHPDTKTIFNITDESERNHFRFKSLQTISGRVLTIWFKYEENNNKIEDKLQMSIPSGLDEDGVKTFILDYINTYLNS